jgi:hypothetical protein
MHSTGPFGARSFGGRSYGVHSYSGPLSSARTSSPAFSARARAFSRPFNRGGTHIQIRSYGYGRYCGSWGCGYGYPGYGWYDPFWYDPYWWWDNDSSQDQDYANDRAYADQMNAQSLEEQQERNQQDQDLYARSAPPPPQQQSTPTESMMSPTVLVFRDQHKQEVQNYAIVGQTLWTFAPQKTQKIPLSDLDIPATQKANDEHGVDFKVPGAGEGQ